MFVTGRGLVQVNKGNYFLVVWFVNNNLCHSMKKKKKKKKLGGVSAILILKIAKHCCVTKAFSPDCSLESLPRPFTVAEERDITPKQHALYVQRRQLRNRLRGKQFVWYFLTPFNSLILSCTDLYHTWRLIPSLIHSHVSSGRLVCAGSQSPDEETQGRGERASVMMRWRQRRSRCSVRWCEGSFRGRSEYWELLGSFPLSPLFWGWGRNQTVIFEFQF